MPLGFQRSKKRRNLYKKESSHIRRQNIENSLRNTLLGNDYDQLTTQTFELGGGLSRDRPQASHRKKTTRQKSEEKIMFDHESQSEE